MIKKSYISQCFGLGICLSLSLASHAETVSEIISYVTYSNHFASAGQPTAAQLQLVKKSGVERVIYLAFNDNMTAIENEDRVVKSLGMDYIHIPVDFDNPTLEDFQTFSAVMQQHPKMNTLLHCQVNFRASTFSLLYRVIFLKVPLSKAKESFDTVWEPNPVWFSFLQDTLKHYQISGKCDECDWGVNTFAKD